MIRRSLIAIVSILLLFSCSTVGVLMQPDWTFSTPKVNGYVVYVGHGTGITESAARDSAYQEILRELGKDLGYDISTQYLREFISNGNIEELSTSISDSYSYENSSGEWQYYAMARTAQEALLSSRSPSYIDLLDREAQIDALLEETIAYYRDNRDVDAINKVLEAISISLDGDINNPDHTPEALRTKAIGYIYNLRLSLSKQSRDSIGVDVHLKRTRGFFHPAVEDAIVLASYKMMDVNGNTISTTMRAMTDSSGEFRYLNTNPYTLREGAIEFSIALDSTLLAKIKEKAGEEFLDDLYDVLDSKSIIYTYKDRGRYSSDELLMAIALYDDGGNPVDSTLFIASLSGYLSNAKVEGYRFVSIVGDEFEDMYYDLEETYPEYRYFAIMRVGLTEFKEYQDDIYARVESRVVIYDSLSKEDIAIQDSNILGVGKNSEEASNNAFEKQARIIAGHLLEEI